MASEQAGKLTDKVSAALLEAGLFSLFLTAADGGLAGDRVDLFEAVEEVSRADGSAGWCLSVCGATLDFVNKAATAEARREVFGA